MDADLTLLPVGGAPAAGLTDALASAAGYPLSEKADATRRAYRADIRRFSTWCEAVGAIALPATPATVAAYLAALADLRLKVSTISRRAAAIAYAHKLAGFEPPIQDAQRQFQLVFRRFIGVFARPEHPLALFLDDLQWLNSATRDLIENLLTESDVRHLMLIGAYRDNEVNSSHPLMRKLEAIRTRHIGT